MEEWSFFINRNTKLHWPNNHKMNLHCCNYQVSIWKITYVHFFEKDWKPLICILFLNTPKIVHIVSSPFLGHCYGGIIMEIQKSSLKLLHSTGWLVKTPLLSFLASGVVWDFSNSLRGQSYLVFGSLLCNSTLIVVLATSYPCCLGSYTLFSVSLAL